MLSQPIPWLVSVANPLSRISSATSVILEALVNPCSATWQISSMLRISQICSYFQDITCRLLHSICSNRLLVSAIYPFMLEDTIHTGFRISSKLQQMWWWSLFFVKYQAASHEIFCILWDWFKDVFIKVEFADLNSSHDFLICSVYPLNWMVGYLRVEYSKLHRRTKRHTSRCSLD